MRLYQSIELVVKALTEFTGQRFIQGNQSSVLQYPIGLITVQSFEPVSLPSRSFDNVNRLTVSTLFEGIFRVWFITQQSTDNNTSKTNHRIALNTITDIVNGWYSEQFKHIWYKNRALISSDLKCDVLGVEGVVDESQVGRKRGEGTFYSYSTSLRLSLVESKSYSTPAISQVEAPTFKIVVAKK